MIGRSSANARPKAGTLLRNQPTTPERCRRYTTHAIIVRCLPVEIWAQRSIVWRVPAHQRIPKSQGAAARLAVRAEAPPPMHSSSPASHSLARAEGPLQSWPLNAGINNLSLLSGDRALVLTPVKPRPRYLSDWEERCTSGPLRLVAACHPVPVSEHRRPSMYLVVATLPLWRSALGLTQQGERWTVCRSWG